jgi:hypothetical protein
MSLLHENNKKNIVFWSLSKNNISNNISINICNNTNSNSYNIVEYKKKEIGFIILRHVNSSLTNNYWIHCYSCIRKFYPENNILIIDDNSDYKYISEINLYKTTIIKSEFPKRGEFLPYYYFLHYKFFDIAVFIHDSVFINQYVDLYVNKYKILWTFEHNSDQIEDETKMISSFNDKELLEFYNNKKLWKGCFGGMSIIEHDYLKFIDEKYNINILLDHIKNRYNRCSFERVIACLLQKNHELDTLFGNIHRYCRWGITYSEKDYYTKLPFLKVWSGR